jgi:hypothetical protein
MPLDASSRLLGLSIRAKGAQLSEFIANDLERRSARGLHVAGGCYLVIARSPDSPVAQALCTHAGRLAATGIRIRAIFGEIEPGGTAALAAPFALPSECRLACDPRLLAAHEQLVLAPDCAWIGDSMRREPRARRYGRFAGVRNRRLPPLVRAAVAGAVPVDRCRRCPRSRALPSPQRGATRRPAPARTAARSVIE